MIYSSYEADALGPWWAVDLKLIVREAALQQKAVYILFPFCLSARWLRSPVLAPSLLLADFLSFVSLIPSNQTSARPIQTSQHKPSDRLQRTQYGCEGQSSLTQVVCFDT